jgi:hypothetical protein
MKQGYPLLCCLFVGGALADTSPPTLFGPWRLQWVEIITYSPAGKVIKRETQRPSATSFSKLVITAHAFVYYLPGKRSPTSQPYARRADTLFVRPGTDTTALAVTITRLEAHQLTLHFAETPVRDSRYYHSVYNTFLVR